MHPLLGRVHTQSRAGEPPRWGDWAPTRRPLLPPELTRARRPPHPGHTRGCRTGVLPRGRSAGGRPRARRLATRALDFGLRRRVQWPRVRSTGPRAPKPGSPRPSRPQRPRRATPLVAARERANGPTTRSRVQRPPCRPATTGDGAPGAAAGRRPRPPPRSPRGTTRATMWTPRGPLPPPGAATTWSTVVERRVRVPPPAAPALRSSRGSPAEAQAGGRTGRGSAAPRCRLFPPGGLRSLDFREGRRHARACTGRAARDRRQAGRARASTGDQQRGRHRQEARVSETARRRP